MRLDRITHRSDFLKANRGRKFATPGLVLQARRRNEPNETGSETIIRVGFTATKKIGNAVTRNRIKRRLRALAREILTESGKPGYDYVLIGRAMTPDRAYSDLVDDLTKALHMVGRPPKASRKKAP